MLTDMCSNKMKTVKEAVKNSKAIALKSCFWTSLGNESYYGIVGHWITDDCNLISVILYVCMLLNVAIHLILLNYINSLEKTGI